MGPIGNVIWGKMETAFIFCSHGIEILFSNFCLGHSGKFFPIFGQIILHLQVKTRALSLHSPPLLPPPLLLPPSPLSKLLWFFSRSAKATLIGTLKLFWVGSATAVLTQSPWISHHGWPKMWSELGKACRGKTRAFQISATNNKSGECKASGA